MATAACVGSITGTPSAASSGARCRAMPAQPMTMTSAPSWSRSSRADLDHAVERALARCRLGDAHVQRPLAGEAVEQSHLAHVAYVPADRALPDGDDAEPLAARQRRQHAALVDAEHRPRRRLAADVQAGIGVAGDDEGIDVVARRHTSRRSGRVTLSTCSCVSMPSGPSVQRAALDLRPVREPHRRQRIGRGPWSRPRSSSG